MAICLDKEGITFNDVLLVPGYVTFAKEDVDLKTRLHDKITLSMPVISSPMDQVTEKNMAIAMAENGGLGIIHRNLTIEKQVAMISEIKEYNDTLSVGVAIGINQNIKQQLQELVKAKPDLFVIDSAQGHSSLIIEIIKYIKGKYDIPVMAGNVATFIGAKDLIKAGADILRVGIGPGSICSTRVVTGVGVPQLTAIMEVAKACKDTQVTVVADGGIQQIGDIAKALAAGAHAVMLGSLLACRTESAGKTVTINKKQYKTYRGMGSTEAVLSGSSRYGQTNINNPAQVVSEGVSGLVEQKGSVKEYLQQVKGSLRSSFFYVGGKNLKQFQEKAKFIRITTSVMQENHPHSIKIKDYEKNYNM
ncbi:MAG: guanosine monophosphate reductase [Rickettsiales bacterium]|nr:guanosine monophosphate reductase [Rickettsiales bacterium]